MRIRRLLLRTLVAVLLTGAALTGVVFRQNSYDLREERITVQHEGRRLTAVPAPRQLFAPGFLADQHHLEQLPAG